MQKHKRIVTLIRFFSQIKFEQLTT